MNSPNIIPVLALHYMRQAYHELYNEASNREQQARRNPDSYSDGSIKPLSELCFDKAHVLIQAAVIIERTEDVDDLKSLL